MQCTTIRTFKNWNSSCHNSIITLVLVMETKFARFEVPTASVLSTQVFWDVAVSMGVVNSRCSVEMSGIITLLLSVNSEYLNSRDEVFFFSVR